MSQYSVSLSLQVQQALQALKNLTGNFKKVDKEVSATTKELERFEKELKDESATIKNTIGAQTEYINKLKGIQSGLDKSSAKFKKVSAEISKFESKLKGGVTAVQGLTGALAVLGVGATLGKITSEVSRLGKEFSAAEGSVRTLTGADGFDDVQSSISKVTKESGGLTNRIEATAASYQLLSAGVSGASDIESVLAASVDLTTAGFTDQTTAVDALTTVINAYGLEADQAALLTDQLVQTQNDGKLTINEYGAALGKVIPTAATLGVGFAEINAAIAGITLQGQNAEVATSGLNSALNKLAAPTKEGNDILSKYGLTINAASIKADGLAGTLEKLQKITSEQDRIKLFGTEAFKALGPLLNNFEKFEELVGNQAEASGVAKQAVENLANAYATLSKKNENLRSDVGVAVFEQVKPVIGAVLEVVNKLLNAFLNLPGPIKNIIIGIGVLIGLAAGLGILYISIVAIKTGILAATGATTLWAAATTILAAAWSVIVSPITLAVLAVAALIAGAVLLYNKFEPFKDLVDAIFNELVYWGKETLAVISAIGAFGAEMLNNYIAGWKEFFSQAGELWGRFTDFVGENFGKIKDKGKATLTSVKTFFSNAKTNISRIWSALTGDVNKKTEGIGTATNKTTNGIQKVFAQVATNVRKLWSDLMSNIATVSLKVLGGVSDFIKRAFNIDIEAGLKRAVAAAKKAYAESLAPGGAQVPPQSTTDDGTDVPDTPLKDRFQINDIVGGDSPSSAGNSKKQEKDDTKANQAKAYDEILEKQSRSLRLEEAKSDLIKDGLKSLFIYEDAVKKINKTVAAGNRAELIANEDKLRNIRDIASGNKAIKQNVGDFRKSFGEAASIDKGLNNELTTTQELLKGSVEIVSNGLQSGIQGLIDGTKSWGDVLSDITGQLSNLLISFAFNSLTSSLPIPGLAKGGRPKQNQVSLIGEKGPELFVPDGPGTVLTNDQAFAAARSAMTSAAMGDSKGDDGASISAEDTAFDQNTNSITTANNLIRDRETRREETASFNSAIERNTEATIGAGGSMVIETQVINNVEYASIDQVQKASALAIKQARAQVFADMKNRPSIRRQIGVG